MYLAYFDESGDSGLIKSPTNYFVLSCFLVPDHRWLPTLDRIVDLRRVLKRKYGIPVRPEIKATDIRRGRGPLEPLNWSPAERMVFFKRLMGFQARYLDQCHVFSVAIRKSAISSPNTDPWESAWTYAFQRVQRFCKDQASYAMILPDEGNGDRVKRLLRRMRRIHYIQKAYGAGGSISAPLDRVVEDPMDRKSQESYFTQLADWNAFAAHRSHYLDPRTGTDPKLWDMLGPRHLTAVNKVRGGPPGLVIWP